MLRRVLKRKKTLGAIALTLAVAATSGMSYAWFADAAKALNHQVEVGDVVIEGDFKNDHGTELYEPGTFIETEGKLYNRGSLKMVAVLNVKTEVQFVSDEEGAPLENEDDYYILKDDPNIYPEFDPSVLGYKENSDGDVYWFKIKNQPGKYAVAMEGPTYADIRYNLMLDGPGMGNVYQGAHITYAGNWTATQVVDAAMLEHLGFEYKDLQFIDVDLTAKSGRRAMTSFKTEGTTAAERAAAFFGH